MHMSRICWGFTTTTSASQLGVFRPKQRLLWRSKNNHVGRKHAMEEIHTISESLTTSTALLNNQDDALLAFWVFAFASSHIGMSAIRDRIIGTCGNLAARSNVVGRDEWILPPWWPGDDAGKNKLFPDAETTGRQLYRLGYTVISFATLGSALVSYLEATHRSLSQPVVFISNDVQYSLLLAVAAGSFGISIASLFNPSPLSLVPGFTTTDGNTDASLDHTTTNNDSSSTLGILQRDDSLKLNVKGLTRITRHPLILPVVPWGFATSILAGGRVADFLLFGGLAVYALAGCAAQDLRILRKEGSVGTVFSQDDETNEGLEQFFGATSFLPFGAIADGRQSATDTLREVPWIALLVGCAIGVWLENSLLALLVTTGSN